MFSHLPRIYINTPLKCDSIVNLPSENIFHLQTVLRMRLGDALRIFNENDGEFVAIVANISPNLWGLKINRQISMIASSAHNLKLILALSIIKSDKMLLAIDMATQIGVDCIVPIIATRSQFQEINKARFLKRIIESTEQSGRITPPSLEEPISLIKYNPDGITIFCHPKANMHENSTSSTHENTTYKNILNSKSINTANPLSINVLIGPEGGFTQEELDYIRLLKNAHTITLSPNILRSETATITALSQVQLMLLEQDLWRY